MNFAGAVAFLPFVHAARARLGLPDAPPFYHWVLSTWVLAFGAAYLYQGLTARGNRAVLALGAVGKLSFAVALVAATRNGPGADMAMVSALPDLILALWFVAWLGRTRPGG
jgi:hypothetical protein